jgi:hypothetical protein
MARNQFINRAIDDDVFIVGSGLRSCTSEIQVSPKFTVDGHPVVLIDTPGFNDTTVEDADVLKEISAFLATVSVNSSSHRTLVEPCFRYQSQVKLAGVIYFHRISDDRWRKSDTRSFGWLQRICGEQTLRNVVLTTNMWGNVDQGIGAARERQLAEEFVKAALDKGAQLRRHSDTTQSAHDIIRAILENRRAALQVQQELVDENREFDRTTVGQEINREVVETTRRLEQQVQELRNALTTVRGREQETRSELEAEIAALREEIKRNTEGSGNMNADYKKKKSKAEKLWASLWPQAAGIGISGIVLYGLYYCLRLYLI